MADIATAYVQIVPSARGMGSQLSNVLGGEMPSAGKSAGGILGSSIVGTLKKVLASAAIGEAIKKTLLEGSELQQLKGGVEKIFNDMDTSQIFADAANAYKDLNMSANEYLATINDVGASFAATMGDEKGYSVAKTGLQAISDYASGTGKSVDVLSEKFTMITRSTSSYQSIADQFSGILPATSKDFLKQAQAAGLLSTKYKKLTDVPVAEYQEAVAEMLKKGTEQLGLAGNTAAETATTFSGSFAAMNAALSNVLGGLALGEDIGPALNNLAETVSNFLIGNLIPMVWNIIKALPGAVMTFLKALLPADIGAFVNDAIANLSKFVNENLPVILTIGTEILIGLIDGFLKGLPDFIASAGEIIRKLGQIIMEALPSIIASGGELIYALAQGLVANLPSIVAAAVSIIAQLLSSFASHIPDLLAMGLNLIVNLVTGLIAGVPDAMNAITDLIVKISNVFGSFDWANLGRNIVNGIISGIQAMGSALKGALQSILDAALAAVKATLGIKSPSRLYRKEVGYQLPAGAALGVKDGLPLMIRAMDEFTDATNTAFTSRLRMGASQTESGGFSGRQIVINQYIYSQAQTAADLMREARYEAEKAVLLGV